MVNKDTMDRLNALGFGADIDALESHVEKMQDAAGLGTPLADDAIYDAHFRLLKQLKPESSILTRNWEAEDNELTEYDSLLDKYGMTSITTITEMGELYKFKEVLDSVGDKVDLIATLKQNGHGVRAVYLNGQLYKGTTRGRYKQGRDITRHMKLILPNYVDAWKNTEIVEIRGEMLVAVSTFENILKGKLKTPLSSVTSLIRDSATDDEIKLLDMVCFKVLSSDDTLEFDSLWDELEHLSDCGFKTPQKAKVSSASSNTLDKAVGLLIGYFEGLMDNGEVDYSCDGVVIAINDNDLFYSLGKSGNTWNANFATKMGKYWESNVYSAIINEVVFMPGKTYMTPKALVDPVVTANGSSVSTVPLYNVGVMQRYGYIPGETIFFRYGGETGVTLTDYLGNSCSAT